MKENPTRREALQVGAGAAACIVIGTTAQAANNVIQSPELEKRMKAFSECTWEGFQGDKISFPDGNSIKVGETVIAFDDEIEIIQGTQCGNILELKHIKNIQGIIRGNIQEQAFFFKEVLGMREDTYWLADIFSFGRQKTLGIDSNSGVSFGSRGDGWGERTDSLTVRKII